MSAAMITDGAFLPDGNMVLRGYGNLAVIAAPSTVENGRLRTLASKALPDQEQGESLAVVEDGAFALIGSEGENSPVLRVRIPEVATETPEPTSDPSAEASSGSSAPIVTDLAGGDTRVQLIVGAGAAVLALAALIGAAILLRPRRR